ncbi:dermatopontin-like isoform X1 [Physella acuta]|uniref:dermatopontin-like isoform X1 n=1 Tax=Physella acuta TaxID=109671 RepID=UPI0027DC9680|nr:dermatopontin-like isoform X1 [Physella acuta]
MMLTTVCGFLLTFMTLQCHAWMTEYDQHFKIECPAGQTIKTLESIHDNGKEDRVWNFGCATPPHGAILSACEWSGYKNSYDQLLEFQCPNDGIITGVESIHDNGHEDRMWGFQCCNPDGHVSHACEYTPYVNQYDQMLTYRVPDGMVLRGVTSVHDNGHEDRIFKFDICKLDPLGGQGGIIVG